jgi:predicted Rossmann-fold nucleotide-binding protein
MPKNIFSHPFDLISPDGRIKKIKPLKINEIEALVHFEKISPYFKGFEIDKGLIKFNIKSTFAQLGVDGVGISYDLNSKLCEAEVLVKFKAFNPIGEKLLNLFSEGLFVGKLFAADDRRRVRHAEYLQRLLGKSDESGNPLLVIGEGYKTELIIEQPEKNRTIVKIPLLPGVWTYDDTVYGFLHTIVKGLKQTDTHFRSSLFLHQIHEELDKKIPKDGMLLVRTMNMSIRSLFAKVVHEELPEGYHHASADIIEPQKITGDIFEFHGESDKEITHVPLEFYTLEPFREHFFFCDRDLLRECLEDPESLFTAFETAPEKQAATFIVKGEQLVKLGASDWLISDIPIEGNLVLPPQDRKDQVVLNNFIKSQAVYTILKAMQEGVITSEGIILTTFLPAPILKSFLLNERVTRSLKAIYFKTPSLKYGDYFSHDDRTMLQDLAKASVDVFWVDFTSHLLLKYVMRPDKDFGMFVPVHKVEDFKKATFFGIYGSRLSESDYKEEFKACFKGLMQMKNELDHDKLNPETAIAVSTGGGPGVMSMGNQIANELGLLSCGHAVDFRKPHETDEEEEPMNPYIQAKMTYGLEQLIIRQSEFGLDFPIFCQGGVGTDFEYALEILRTQVGNRPPAPVLLFGSPDYWKAKISSVYHINRKIGTIRGTEWVSNVFFCVQNHKQALAIYYKYFTNRLPIGPNHPPADDGFHIVSGEESLFSTS